MIKLAERQDIAAYKTVQTFIGHATLQMITDTYGRMFRHADHSKAMDAIAKALFT